MSIERVEMPAVRAALERRDFKCARHYNVYYVDKGMRDNCSKVTFLKKSGRKH